VRIVEPNVGVGGDVVRFDVVTRTVHWLTAALTLILLATGSILYVPELSAFIGRRALLKQIHVVSGLILPLPLAVGVALGRAGHRLRADLVDLGRWEDGDSGWLRTRTRQPAAGKFNGGQKLATALFGGALAVQLLTGAIMYWNHPFPDDWRTGATFVHDWAYLALVALVLGHVGKAMREPELRSSMITGTVPRAWARHERPGWRVDSAQPEPTEAGSTGS
jgi:formate dehydrogenase subunit gamma